MTKFKLSEDQEKAINKIKEFLKSRDIDFVLSGMAGAGKTYLLNLILDYVDSLGVDYCICAPTNKAKIILEEATGRKAVTVHSLLSMSPDVGSFKLDYKNLKFQSKDSDVMPQNGIIFVDECSMINDEIHKLLIENCKKYENKIIFLGDKRQLNPVKESFVSKTFKSKWSSELNTVHRQSNKNLLLPIINNSRENYNSNFKEIIDENGSLYTFDNISDFISSAVPLFQESIRKGDVDLVKICCYTNARVEAYNKALRKIVFEDEAKNEYNKKEILTCYESSKSGDYKVSNSSDYIIKKVKPHNISIPNIGIFPGYIITIQGKRDLMGFPFYILSKKISENDFKGIARIIEEIRMEAISLKNKNRQASARKWNEYFKIMESFASPIDLIYDNRVIKKKTFDYGYAISTHKSQGSGYKNVMVDMKDISICRNPEERRQLQYVAISRTKKDLYILQ